MKLESKTIKLRLVEERDAGFILNLRLDERYNRFLSSVNPDLDAQVKWIKEYKNNEAKGNEYYFIIETLNDIPCGTVRVYDIRDDSFCWGSWILNEDKTRYAAIESAFLVYKFGFETLKFKKSHFDVMKENVGVISFHKKMGAVEVGDDELNFYFEIYESSVNEMRERLKDKIS